MPMMRDISVWEVYINFSDQPSSSNYIIFALDYYRISISLCGHSFILIPVCRSYKTMKADQKKATGEQGKLQNFIKDAKTLEILRNKGVKALFPVQYRTFQTLSAGKDLMVRDKTGSGKTLAFALPVITRLRKERAFEKNHLAKFLVVLPTRELALQVKEEIESLRFKDEPDFRVVAVYGKADMQAQIRTIEKGIDIIVATPGRLIDLLERGVIKMNELQVLCLDQADEMLKQGFKEDLQKIYKYITDHAPRKTQNLLFSATIPDWLHDISRTYQQPDTQFINLLKDDPLLTPPTLTHLCLKLDRADEAFKAKVVRNLLRKYAINSGNSIIFCERKADVERLASSLNDCYGLKSETLHSDVAQPKRQRVYRSFKSGELKCIIATNVAARGLDFPEIDIVIQTEPPQGVEPYIHRSGRTARKGRPGISVTIFNDKTQRLINNIEREAKITMKHLKAEEFLRSDRDKEPLQRKRAERQKEKQRVRDRRDRRGNDSDDEEKKYCNNRSRSRSRDRYKEKETAYNDESDHEIYAKYLPTDKTQNDIKEYFHQRRVEVKTVKLLKTSEGQSKGCGFLKFGTRGARDQCLMLDGESFDGNRISLSLPNQR